MGRVGKLGLYIEAHAEIERFGVERVGGGVDRGDENQQGVASTEPRKGRQGEGGGYGEESHKPRYQLTAQSCQL